jgi:hypothetical protein
VAGIASEEGIDVEINEETTVIGSNDEVIGSDTDTYDGLSEFLGTEGVVQSFRSSRVSLHLALHPVVIGWKVEQTMFVDDGVEALKGVAQSFVEIPHKKNFDPLRMACREECVKVGNEALARVWF